MHWFYSQQIKGQSIRIDGDEGLHAIKVLRVKEGQSIIIIDGVGGYYQCEVEELSKKSLDARIISAIQNYKQRAFKIHIAISPTKNISRFEWFLEKATELGIDQITPIKCSRSERKIIKRERLQKVLVAATKQSQKATLPILNEMCSFNQFITSLSADGEKFIAHCNYEDNPHIVSQLQSAQDVTILIGPEGDFTDNEVEEAKLKAVKEIGLGNERLRTETAGIAACHSIHLFHQFLDNK